MDKLFAIAGKFQVEESAFAIWTPHDNEVELSEESQVIVNSGMEDVLSRQDWTRRWINGLP